MREVSIVGIGYTSFSPVTPDLSWKELMFEAATRAYADAGIDPRKDVQSFITCAEDYWEGFSIFDEFTPDQLGAALRLMHTVAGDGLLGLANAYMQIKTGLFDIVVVEAHSKISDLLTYEDVLMLAFDPIYEAPLGGHPHYLAGLEMREYLAWTGTTEEECAAVAVKNKWNALRNPLAPYGAAIAREDVLSSPYLFAPLKKLEIAPLVDGAIVLVLAEGELARRLTDKAVLLEGIGWSSESPWVGTRLPDARYARLAAELAYAQAGITNPIQEIDLAEVDDRFAYKELQHLEALGLARPGEAGQLLLEGAFDLDGQLPVNLSGGSLGMGDAVEAGGLQRALEIILQLRGEAGARQLPDPEVGLAMSWRGLPHGSGAVAIFRREA
ncbi:MAG: acetyl-CoA acetyltransferase [Candidatus Acetothermia bacterium]|jgi:acetyl-CoA C-acetyltransferase|nr:acetyl-CoA acetyltransferase [Candidatus Acetothermia bacterium]MDH7504778.1 acetyl-CoA acetyltransferase [Candidatus Acetothermia bacterium]